MRFFASETSQGTKITGVVSKRELNAFRSGQDSQNDLQKTQPFVVAAAPGFCYMLIEIVTAGNILSPHLIVVNTEPKSNN